MLIFWEIADCADIPITWENLDALLAANLCFTVHHCELCKYNVTVRIEFIVKKKKLISQIFSISQG